ncbi:MAG: hypothetical protein R3356_06250 [Eudoraea sp.]|nr:hypothetical protein [Eudoraea sp.]
MAQIVKTIGDREYGFQFNMLTIRKYCEYRGIDFSDYDNDFASDIMVTSEVLFKAAADVYSKGKVILDEYELAELFENMTNDEYKEIITCYSEGMRGAYSVYTGGKKPTGKPDTKKK